MDQAITQPAVETSTVVELRQYTMQPGGRDKLIGMFEDRFVEGQEAAGMRVLGQFRDAKDPNRFVWMRGFRDMPSRASSVNDGQLHRSDSMPQSFARSSAAAIASRRITPLPSN